MQRKDIIVIGTSTGGIDALKELAAALPGDLRASVFITLHVAPYSLGILPEILERAGPLPASNAEDWEQFERGRIYVAPPDHHLLVEPSGHVRITRGPRENRFRPAIDPLFRSAAHAYGPRVVGVILTGWLDDGAAGLWAVKERGGAAIVQHPEDAFAPAMPLNALKRTEADHVVPLNEIAPLLVRLTETPAGEEEGVCPVSEEMDIEVKIAREDNALESGIMKWGEPSVYACPECHGVLLQLKEGGNMRFRCHTGHAYSVDSLLAEYTEKTEESLWSSIRALEEGVLLMRELAKHFGEHHNSTDAEALLRKAEESQQRANLVRSAVMNHDNLSLEKVAD
ncbi:MAG TPA: chemotaxis protein CheB [Pyrinomonadaceae bacterium]|jgi:two-component system chemotaxis response regulator CheB|nr:chemotaxis protein CheB [Pyrinomonadaceae bacterium]